jgi:hypothetical protein
LADFLTDMNVMVNDINFGETIPQASYDRLIQGANRSANKLAVNGSNFVRSIISPTFTGISQNLQRIKFHVPNDSGLNSMLERFDSLLNVNTEKLYGFSKEDFQELDNFYETVRSVKDKAIDGQSTSGDVRNLVTQGNTTFNRLIAKYNLFDDQDSSGGSNNNNSGGGTSRR